MVFKAKSAKEDQTESQSSAMTFIGKGSEITGDVHASGNLRVDGVVRGNILVDGDLEVSVGGVVEGKDVSARNIVIHGLVKATITAGEQLRIHAQGEVQGDVTAQSLDIEAGARFIGYSHTGKPSAEIFSMEQSAKKET